MKTCDDSSYKPSTVHLVGQTGGKLLKEPPLLLLNSLLLNETSLQLIFFNFILFMTGFRRGDETISPTISDLRKLSLLICMNQNIPRQSKQSKQVPFYNKTSQVHKLHKFFLSKNSTRFGQFLCPSSGVFFTVISALVMSYKFDDRFQAGPEWNCRLNGSSICSSILVLLEGCHKNCMTNTSAECTVKNSWWWAEELPETCTFLRR